MSEKKFVTSEQQTYCFAFGSDEKLYTVSFKGDFPGNAPDKILAVAGKTTYEKAGDAIHAYLEHNRLEYSDFKIKESFLKHHQIMEWADALLHSDASNIIDNRIGNADHYYAVMDHQKWIQQDRCEGYYLAIKRKISDKTYDRLYIHNVIGQSFIYNEANDENISYFTIRKRDGLQPFHNLYISKGRPVLPTFGCVDLIELLRNIESVHNATQAKAVSIK